MLVLPLLLAAATAPQCTAWRPVFPAIATCPERVPDRYLLWKAEPGGAAARPREDDDPFAAVDPFATVVDRNKRRKPGERPFSLDPGIGPRPRVGPRR